jgi:large subunit ribosomal protein L46
MMSSAATGALRRQLSRHSTLPIAPRVLQSWRTFTGPALSYREEKKAAKDRRREIFEASVDRAEKVLTRREGRDVGARRRIFNEWFEKKKVWNEIQDRKARQAGMEWKIDCALIVERLPVVFPDMAPWEKDWENLRDYLDSFGKDYPKELNLGDRLPMGTFLTDEELFAQLPEGYKPAPRVTEADENGDVKTLKRRLMERVYFLVQKDGRWTFPVVALKEDETFMDASKRAVVETVGEKMDIYYVSTCPLAVDMSILTEEERAKVGVYGTKTFFMKVQHDEFDASLGKEYEDYAWLTRGEITDRMKEQDGDHASRFYHYVL